MSRTRFMIRSLNIGKIIIVLRRAQSDKLILKSIDEYLTMIVAVTHCSLFPKNFYLQQIERCRIFRKFNFPSY